MQTKVLPINYIDDLEKVMREEGCSAVGIEEMSITYIQPADTNSSSDEVQLLTITSRTAAGADFDSIEKQEGYYFDLSIPDGGHWSVEEGENLKALIDDFKQRLYQVNEFNQ